MLNTRVFSPALLVFTLLLTACATGRSLQVASFCTTPNYLAGYELGFRHGFNGAPYSEAYQPDPLCYANNAEYRRGWLDGQRDALNGYGHQADIIT